VGLLSWPMLDHEMVAKGFAQGGQFAGVENFVTNRADLLPVLFD